MALVGTGRAMGRREGYVGHWRSTGPCPPGGKGGRGGAVGAGGVMGVRTGAE